MDHPQTSAGAFRWIIGVLLAAGLLLVGVVAARSWNHPDQLTQHFVACMQKAPFQTSLTLPRPETVLSPAQLQEHLDRFDRIKAETGLPPVWNGSTLVPWTEFHRESIEVARRCHTELNIDQPQRQLRGTYAKPVWDPSSPIWSNP